MSSITINFLNKDRVIEFRPEGRDRYGNEYGEITAIYNNDPKRRRCRRLEHAVATLDELQHDFYDAIDWTEPDLRLGLDLV